LDGARIVTRSNIEEWWDTRHGGEPPVNPIARRLSEASRCATDRRPPRNQREAVLDGAVDHHVEQLGSPSVIATLRLGSSASDVCSRPGPVCGHRLSESRLTILRRIGVILLHTPEKHRAAVRV
jgi:hypothetical protein